MIWDALEVKFGDRIGINGVQGKAEIHVLLIIVDMVFMIASYLYAFEVTNLSL